MVPPPSQNTVGVCNQITLLMLYYISHRLVTLLRFPGDSKRVTDIFYLAVGFKVTILAFKYSFFVSLNI